MVRTSVRDGGDLTHESAPPPRRARNGELSGTPGLYSAGAQSVLPREVSAPVLRRTVEATIEGQAVLLAAVTLALATGTIRADDTDPVITTEQLGWLRHLVAGTTVAELAQLVGYSERAMYRLLRLLYRQLGARSRIEAIIQVQERGLL